jgi:hypothetical protein
MNLEIEILALLDTIRKCQMQSEQVERDSGKKFKGYRRYIYLLLISVIEYFIKNCSTVLQQMIVLTIGLVETC